MVLKDVKYSTTETTDTITPEASATAVQGSGVTPPPKDYGAFDLGFSISAPYSNFVNFTKDLESNLRIVDVTSIEFSSEIGTGTSTQTGSASDAYKYDFKIRTYWLKN